MKATPMTDAGVKCAAGCKAWGTVPLTGLEPLKMCPDCATRLCLQLSKDLNKLADMMLDAARNHTEPGSA
jgi:hypothetical protein